MCSSDLSKTTAALSIEFAAIVQPIGEDEPGQVVRGSSGDRGEQVGGFGHVCSLIGVPIILLGVRDVPRR